MENNKTPTAEQILEKHLKEKTSLTLDLVTDRLKEVGIGAMKEFASLHVEKALRTVHKLMKENQEASDADLPHILKIYPLDDIQ